jgi:hypothetical protein
MGPEFKSIAGSDVAALWWLRRLAGEPLDLNERAARAARHGQFAVDAEPDAQEPFACAAAPDGWQDDRI